MTKNDAIAAATALNVAVYRADTVAQIVARTERQARINAEMAEAASAKVGKLAAFIARGRLVYCRPSQFCLALHAPRDWSIASGQMARA